MRKTDVIKKTVIHVRSLQQQESTGHDWWHTHRVWQMAKKIGRIEKADLLVVQLSALLHDVADWKSHEGDFEVGAREARTWLSRFSLDPKCIDHICWIVQSISFKGVAAKRSDLTLEAMVVQDSDRLDALGAIGIARTFAYGGSKGRAIYDPSVRPVKHKTVKSYVDNKSPSINHFYEKLLLLKTRMHTETARRIASNRDQIIRDFLREFYDEWRGRK